MSPAARRIILDGLGSCLLAFVDGERTTAEIANCANVSINVAVDGISHLVSNKLLTCDIRLDITETRPLEHLIEWLDQLLEDQPCRRRWMPVLRDIKQAQDLFAGADLRVPGFSA